MPQCRLFFGSHRRIQPFRIRKRAPLPKRWSPLKFLIRQEPLAILRLFTIHSPCLNDILGSFISEGLYSRLFGDFFGTVGYDSYFLGSCFFALLNIDGLETWQLGKRRTDVSFTSASDYTGHTGHVGHILSHCCGSKSKDRQRHGCDNFFHSDSIGETGIRQPRC